MEEAFPLDLNICLSNKTLLFVVLVDVILQWISNCGLVPDMKINVVHSLIVGSPLS